jgi:predicted secreted protein
VIPQAFALIAAAATLATPAIAGDAAARRIIGFSPDGSYFAFEQYTDIYDEDAAFSEIVVIDTNTDRFVPGMPVKVLIREDDDVSGKSRTQAAAQAKPIIDQFRIVDAGAYVAGKPSMMLDDVGIYQMKPEPLAKSLAFKLPGGRSATLSVTDKAMGQAMCDGYGGRGAPGRAKVAGLRLTLDVAGTPAIVMQNDNTLPKGRRCAAAYGIAEAHLHTAPDGTVTLAALIEFADNHDFHAGPNRRFMAVTKRLPKP